MPLTRKPEGDRRSSRLRTRCDGALESLTTSRIRARTLGSILIAGKDRIILAIVRRFSRGARAGSTGRGAGRVLGRRFVSLRSAIDPSAIWFAITSRKASCIR